MKIIVSALLVFGVSGIAPATAAPVETESISVPVSYTSGSAGITN